MCNMIIIACTTTLTRNSVHAKVSVTKAWEHATPKLEARCYEGRNISQSNCYDASDSCQQASCSSNGSSKYQDSNNNSMSLESGRARNKHTAADLLPYVYNGFTGGVYCYSDVCRRLLVWIRVAGTVFLQE